MGSTDKTVRLIVAAVIAVLYLLGILKGITGLVILIIGIALVVTSLVGFCPVYQVFGLNSKRKSTAD